MTITFDEKDQAILAERVAALDKVEGPRVGDFVTFADGTERRISYCWRAESGETIESVQTSDGGSYYLGKGYVSMSGSLYRSVPADTLRPIRRERRDGSVWFFHHDWSGAGHGVYTSVPFRVFTCSLPATS